MWTHLAEFLADNALLLKSYITKTPMTGNWFQCILLILDLEKTLFFIQILVSKLLYCVSFLFFTQKFFSNAKKTFPISLMHIDIQDPNFYGLKIILQLITIFFILKNRQVTLLVVSISYLHLRENLKTGIISKENFNLPIIYIANFSWKKEANTKRKHSQVCVTSQQYFNPLFTDSNTET